MAAKTYTTYPILLFCGREALSTIVKDIFLEEDGERKELIRRYIIATAWFVATLVFAIEVPDIGIVINLLGKYAKGSNWNHLLKDLASDPRLIFQFLKIQSFSRVFGCNIHLHFSRTLSLSNNS